MQPRASYRVSQENDGSELIMVAKREADRENMPGLPIEKKPGNVNTAAPAGKRAADVEKSPSPYDRAEPGTPDNRIIRQGEPEQPGPTSDEARSNGGSGSQSGEVAVGLGDGLEGAPVQDFDSKDAAPADARSMKERHGTRQEDAVNEVQPSRKADAEVGLGEGMEGAPVEEYEEELEIGSDDAHKKRSA
jgi:hypothetical protein